MSETTLYRAHLNGILVYVGVSKPAMRRVSEHGWKTDVIEVEHFQTREEAEAVERDMVERFRPPYNKMFNDLYQQERGKRLAQTQHRGRGAEIVKAARKETGLTQAAMAQQAGVTQQAVSAYETGRMEPTLPSLLALLESVGLELRFHLEPLQSKRCKKGRT